MNFLVLISFIFLQFLSKILPNNRFSQKIQRLVPPPAWEILNPSLEITIYLVVHSTTCAGIRMLHFTKILGSGSGDNRLIYSGPFLEGLAPPTTGNRGLAFEFFTNYTKTGIFVFIE